MHLYSKCIEFQDFASRAYRWKRNSNKLNSFIELQGAAIKCIYGEQVAVCRRFRFVLHDTHTHKHTSYLHFNQQSLEKVIPLTKTPFAVARPDFDDKSSNQIKMLWLSTVFILFTKEQSVKDPRFRTVTKCNSKRFC